MQRQIVWLAVVAALGVPTIMVMEGWGAMPAAGISPAEVVLTVKNDTLFALIREPEYRLTQARTSLQSGRGAEAARALEAVQAFVWLERARAASPAMDMLIDATIDLDKLVSDSARGVLSMPQLADAARLTHMALASHYQLMAQAAWAQRVWQVTGQHLHAAGLHIRQAMAWGGSVLTDPQQALLKENEFLAEALMDGPGCGNSWAEDAAQARITAIGQLVDALKPAKAVLP